ncbi:MGDG synthase family glycosyltransferase [Dendrosporobacter sp. 1207_IL3150]|uniref:MGDG synthase family glycosyltransferase n=1 Tax=Dendrosporobacter sp. 1207_IL3150 TaxID=3084054 RepID=UPI002FD96BAC
MDKPAKILFLSAPIGSGHIRAANAINDAILCLRPDVNTRLINVFDFFSKSIGNFLLKTYFKILDFFPSLYGMMYGMGNTNKLALIGREIVSRFLANRMCRYIQDYSPTLIICTHATPAGLIAYLIKEKRIDIPAVAVVTDFVIHRLWIYEDISYYFVASEELRKFLEQYGITRSNSNASGIPIASSFSEMICTEKLREKLDVPSDIKTILLMGGGAGVMPMAEILIALNEIITPIQVLVVTGSNNKLYKKLESNKGGFKYRVKIFGFIDNIHELMAVSDILVSKPGGMTSSEALSMGLPLVIYRPIPGQEEANTKFLIEKKAAVRAESTEDLVNVINRLFKQDDNNLAVMRENSAKLGRPEAARRIAETIIKKYSV